VSGIHLKSAALSGKVREVSGVSDYVLRIKLDTLLTGLPELENRAFGPSGLPSVQGVRSAGG
jgi:hypothetical protein